jgi:high frequency lysogenization protein
MNKSNAERTLAFAGILQALQLVQQTAYGKPVDQNALQTSIHSIFSLDANSALDVYGNLQGLQQGLELVKSQLHAKNKKPDMELSRYLITILHLEHKLGKRADLLEKLQQGIKQAQVQSEHFSETHTNVIANLADCYSSTISTLQPRIMVNGDSHRLSDSNTANMARSLLLSAMRSAVLWRQAGGSRIGLLFSRQKLVIEAENWLKTMNENPSEHLH